MIIKKKLNPYSLVLNSRIHYISRALNVTRYGYYFG